MNSALLLSFVFLLISLLVQTHASPVKPFSVNDTNQNSINDTNQNSTNYNIMNYSKEENDHELNIFRDWREKTHAPCQGCIIPGTNFCRPCS